MKKSFLFIVTLIFAVTNASRAQNPVVDKYPEATIYIIDPQSGQEVLAQNDDAVLFKDAFIDLINNTYTVKHIIKSPGHKSLVITQADPADGNAFQLVSQSKFLGSEIANYTFSYSVDQNTLYYLDPVSQTWQPELVQGYNVVNLNSCLALGKFNELQVADAGNNNDVQQTGDDNSDDGVTAAAPPPVLQDYEQPECPQDDYLWQPGYWAYSPGGGYYWVAGTWVAPPNEGFLWTPPYWGYEGNVYIFHSGYWGRHIGYYGGINYGYGYAGEGYYGGDWRGGHFHYNTAVVRVNNTYVHNVYVDRTVVRVGVRANVSYNGPGGATNKPTERELNVNNENHIRDYHQNPKAATVGANRRNTPGGSNGINNQNNNTPRSGNAAYGNNGSRNGNVYTPRNGNAANGNNSDKNGSVYTPRNGNAPGTNNQNANTPRNGNAPVGNNGDRNGNVYTPRNGNTPGNNNQDANNPRNGNAPDVPTSNAPNSTKALNNGAVRPGGPGAQRGFANGPGAPGGSGAPAIPKGPGHNNNSNGSNNAPNNGNGGNNAPRNNGNGRSGGRDKGNDKPANPGKKDDKKGN